MIMASPLVIDHTARGVVAMSQQELGYSTWLRKGRDVAFTTKGPNSNAGKVMPQSLSTVFQDRVIPLAHLLVLGVEFRFICHIQLPAGANFCAPSPPLFTKLVDVPSFAGPCFPASDISPFSFANCANAGSHKKL